MTELLGESHVVRYANPAFCKLINKPRDEVIGKPFDNLLPPADECLELLDRVFRTGARDKLHSRRTGGALPSLVFLQLWPVMAEGRTAGVMIQVNETGPLHETRQAISQALLLGALRQDELIEAAECGKRQLQTEVSESKKSENDAWMLTNELAHRVKNNLAVIAALIANEIRRTPEPWVQGYRAMQDRIMAIARLYDLVSQSSQSSRGRTVALKAYLTEIATSLSTSLLEGSSGIRIAVEAETLEIDSDRAMPFGLLVNELSTNAIKHAFPGGIGLVTTAIRRIGDEIEAEGH